MPIAAGLIHNMHFPAVLALVDGLASFPDRLVNNGFNDFAKALWQVWIGVNILGP